MDNHAANTSPVVSFDDESLILVNSNDEVVGYANKDLVHDGPGILHRAFSLFIFNSKSELLLQQRSSSKRLWGGYWSNSVCSHPRQGETLETAVQRRLAEELGFNCPLEYLYNFEYQANFGDIGTEHELCSILVGHFNGEVAANSEEIDSWRWITPQQLDFELKSKPEIFTPWFKLEWHELKLNWASKIGL